MKKKIEISHSDKYLSQHFLKQYKSALEYHAIGENLNIDQILNILDYMGYVD
jgi:hypothetical protein